ncbi:MAG: hypothetical protein Q7R66_14340 [Undibacterium sp.]|nr:hypothetical protein [Undibacterium sp.]MDO8653361.1 hypothetical protein [Undibacterium sp.]
MENLELNKEKEVWETPKIEELAVEQTAHQPGHGLDGDFFVDCTRS